jgi:hypothetical protein
MILAESLLVPTAVPGSCERNTRSRQGSNGQHRAQYDSGIRIFGRHRGETHDGIETNYPNVFETPSLDAFKVTRAGGSHPLFDQMLMGMHIPGAGVGNGTTMTGSFALRKYTTMQKLLAGQTVDPKLVYFRTQPKFERYPNEVVIRFFKVE